MVLKRAHTEGDQREAENVVSGGGSPAASLGAAGAPCPRAPGPDLTHFSLVFHSQALLEPSPQPCEQTGRSRPAYS